MILTEAIKMLAVAGDLSIEDATAIANEAREELRLHVSDADLDEATSGCVQLLAYPSPDLAP